VKIHSLVFDTLLMDTQIHMAKLKGEFFATHHCEGNRDCVIQFKWGTKLG